MHLIVTNRPRDSRGFGQGFQVRLRDGRGETSLGGHCPGAERGNALTGFIWHCWRGSTAGKPGRALRIGVFRRTSRVGRCGHRPLVPSGWAPIESAPGIVFYRTGGGGARTGKTDPTSIFCRTDAAIINRRWW